MAIKLVDRVAEALLRLGLYPFRLDTEQFLVEVKLVAQVSNSKLDSRLEYNENFAKNGSKKLPLKVYIEKKTLKIF